MNALLATIVASLGAWGISALLSGHVSDTTDIVVSFVVSGIVFVPCFVWIKRVREGM